MNQLHAEVSRLETSIGRMFQEFQINFLADAKKLLEKAFGKSIDFPVDIQLLDEIELTSFVEPVQVLDSSIDAMEVSLTTEISAPSLIMQSMVETLSVDCLDDYLNGIDAPIQISSESITGLNQIVGLITKFPVLELTPLYALKTWRTEGVCDTKMFDKKSMREVVLCTTENVSNIDSVQIDKEQIGVLVRTDMKKLIVFFDDYSLSVFAVDGWPIQDINSLYKAMKKAIARSKGSYSGSSHTPPAIDDASTTQEKSGDWEINRRLLKMGENIAYNVVKVIDFGVVRFQNQRGVMTAKIGTYRGIASEKYMADLASLFPHVVVDVSSVRTLCFRWYPRDQKKAPAKENKHRAMDDIRESILELKYFKETIFKAKSKK